MKSTMCSCRDMPQTRFQSSRSISQCQRSNVPVFPIRTFNMMAQNVIITWTKLPGLWVNNECLYFWILRLLVKKKQKNTWPTCSSFFWDQSSHASEINMIQSGRDNVSLVLWNVVKVIDYRNSITRSAQFTWRDFWVTYFLVLCVQVSTMMRVQVSTKIVMLQEQHKIMKNSDIYS